MRMAVSCENTYVNRHEEIARDILARTKQFSRDNIDKALSASGHKDFNTTWKWLNEHIHDPTLNDITQREYILFLCPTGALLNEISKFYEESYSKCGSNSAHNLFPHVTLTSFFKVGDSVLPYILDILKDSVNLTEHLRPQRLELLLQKSDAYIGLFLNDEATLWIAELVGKFVKKVRSNLGLTVKPHERKFHLTLAYNFDLSKTEELENLARNVHIDAAARWELNIYSRETKLNGKQIYVAIRDYKGVNPNQLTLKQHSHVIMDNEQLKDDTWRKGVDFETGRSGIFPVNYTKKTAEWRIWSKNISVPVAHSSSHGTPDVSRQAVRRSQSFNFKKDKKDQSRNSLRNSGRSPSEKGSKNIAESLVKSGTQAANVNIEFRAMNTTDGRPGTVQLYKSRTPSQSPMLRRHDSLPMTQSEDLTRSNLRGSKRKDRETTLQLLQQRTAGISIAPPSSALTKRMFVMRHAERVDLTFGHDWFQVYIDDKGYHRRNLNLPRRIPTRRNGPRDFFMDGPISEIGTFQAKLAGEALRAKGVTFSAVFSSPSLRSIQTATSVLEGLQDSDSRIKIEPALFEWMAWCRNTFPKFMTLDELIAYGMNVDDSYTPFYPISQFNLHEKTDEYYYRSHSFVQYAARNFSGNILLVGHSASLDVCTRQLTGNPIRKTDDLIRVVQKVPFCGLCVAEEQKDKMWKLVQAPIPSLAHGQNQAFDWRVLETCQPNGPYS